jgi:hypothetical protein
MIRMMTGEEKIGTIEIEGIEIMMNSGENWETGEIESEMTLDDRTEIMMMITSETIEIKIKDVITETGVIVMRIDDKIETIIDEIMTTMTGESTIETGVIVMMTSEEKTETEGIDEIMTTMTDKTEITTILAGVREIAMPMLTGDVKTERGETMTIVMMIDEGNSEIEGIEEIAMTMTDKTGTTTILTGDAKTEIGETMTIVMMTCEEKTGTGEIVTTMIDETEIMTNLIDATEIAMTMSIDDVKTEIGETEMIEMMTWEENTETEGINEIMMTLADVTEIKMLTDDVKTETGEITTEMMTEEERIETMPNVRIEMRITAERDEKDRLMIQEMMLITDANNALKITLKWGELSVRTSTNSRSEVKISLRQISVRSKLYKTNSARSRRRMRTKPLSPRPID